MAGITYDYTMKSGIFTLDWGSIADAAVMAAVVAVIGGLVSLVSTAGFDVFVADWVLIGKNMVNLAFVAGVLSLGQAFLSTSSGSVLGITPPREDKK